MKTLGNISVFSIPPLGGPLETRPAGGPEIVIGRFNPEQPQSKPDVAFDADAQVSRRHAVLLSEGARWSIEDKNSKHGTFVEGRDIKGQGPVPVRPGDLIRTGRTTWTFVPAAWLSLEHGSTLVYGPCAAAVSEASRQCGVALIGPLAAVNPGQMPSDPFDVTLSLEGISKPMRVAVPALGPGERVDLSGDMDLLRDPLVRLFHPTDVRLGVTIEGRKMPELSRNVTVLPVTYWSYDRAARKVLAAFVFPHAQIVQDLIDQAERSLPTDARFPEMLARGVEGAEDRIMKALYDALVRQQIAYQGPQLQDHNELPARYQDIRQPHTILSRHRATCLDLALFAAGCLECVGLCPVVVLTGPDEHRPTHAFVGCWRGSTPGARKVMNGEQVKDQVGRGNLLIVETTAAARGFAATGVSGYEEGVALAHKDLEEAPWACGVDIGAARREPSPIRPLLCAESAAVLDVYARARRAAMDRACPQVQYIHLLYGLLEAAGPATIGYVGGDREKLVQARTAVEQALPKGNHTKPPEKTGTFKETVLCAQEWAAAARSPMVEEEHLLQAVLAKGYKNGHLTKAPLGPVLADLGWHPPPDWDVDRSMPRRTIPP